MSNTADIIAGLSQYRNELLMCLGTLETQEQVTKVAFEIIRTTFFIDNATHNLYLDPEYHIEAKYALRSAQGDASATDANKDRLANISAPFLSASANGQKKLAKLKKHLK